MNETYGSFICGLCEQEGKPAGQRFKVPAGWLGAIEMKAHIKEAHPDRRKDAES